MVDATVRGRLGHAGTFAERVQAVRAAMAAGVPLWQIEQYLDLLEMDHRTHKQGELNHAGVITEGRGADPHRG